MGTLNSRQAAAIASLLHAFTWPPHLRSELALGEPYAEVFEAGDADHILVRVVDASNSFPRDAEHEAADVLEVYMDDYGTLSAWDDSRPEPEVLIAAVPVPYISDDGHSYRAKLIDPTDPAKAWGHERYDH